MTVRSSEVHDDVETRPELSQDRPSVSEPPPWRVYHVGFGAPGRVEIFHYDEPALPDRCFRVKTLYSGISTGTELTHFAGTNPYLQARWDEDLKLFVDDGEKTTYPLPFSGYMQVGQVVASRSDTVREGEVVAMSYGHKTGHTANARAELVFPLPPDLDPILGIYAAQMGPICANGILHADEEAYGETAQRFGVSVCDRNVLVCGTGIVGLLTGMMCRWSGAAEVAVVGRNPWKLSVAESLGMLPIDTRKSDPGSWAKQRWHDGQGLRGAHVAFQCTGSDELLQHAFRALQPQAAVIDLGFYQGGAAQVLLGREFHHNGLKHLCAQIGRVPRKLAAHWDRRRLAAETVAFLQEEGPQIRKRLITHTFPFYHAQEAFDLLARDGRQVLQVVLQCEA
jgi:NADPH:quinone reductase-like Zn-dependent oxidoreductase